MRRLVWWLGFAVLIPWTAIAGRVGGEADRPDANRPVQLAQADEDARPVVRMCQSFRVREGKAFKVGKPHPCKEPRNLRLSSNLTGGRFLPQ